MTVYLVWQTCGYPYPYVEIIYDSKEEAQAYVDKKVALGANLGSYKIEKRNVLTTTK